MLQRRYAESNDDPPCAEPDPADGADAGAGLHAVQFYETDAFLASVVARFSATGLSRGESVVLVTTQPHYALINDALRARGVDVDAAIGASRLLVYDAPITLGSIMDRGMPRKERFDAAVDHLLSQAARNGRRSRMRVYGEMVDVLSLRGDTRAAIGLEQLWSNRVAGTPMNLLCAYALNGFPAASDTEGFAEVCRLHNRVAPTEQLTSGHAADKRRQIVVLQQRARALVSELEHRKRLESRLKRAASAARRARKEADRANRARSQFLSVVSHELRTPLNAIGGYTELLELGIHGPVNDEQRDALARIQRNQRHLLCLINQVLEYSRLETGGLRYDITDVAMGNSVDAVASALSPRIAAKHLRFELSCDPGLVVRADREKLQLILFNLLGNATSFTSDGGTIAVECSADSGTVYIAVRDTGVGIPTERLATIFDPFVQGDATFTRVSEGIGLGLAISRELARAMHGSLSAASVPEEGSTFTLALPRVVR